MFLSRQPFSFLFRTEMRASFDAGIPKPLAKRLEQLEALRRFFEENETAILEALKADLGRPTFEALYYDNILPISEIEVSLIHM